MAKIKYAYNEDTGKVAKASGRSLKISPKHSREICNALRGMELEEAKDYLEDVIDKKQAVPFRRHNKKVGHKRGLEGWPTGRYPVKAASQILDVLINAEANAEYQGLETDNLEIVHISSHRGYVIRGWTPRAFGRASPFNTPTTHIQIVLGEI
ncbi:MAG TPA: 50S ribosomal protein L22 [Methanobacterium sp.]|mgnify:FL=1|jgi:large subunit ribosomal protein L22|nr:MAG: 50S ribosomal protein L22 [Methanobacterium sp.]HOI70861.1 50S ribosomal protein L22 [Methanobacterium sp.]HPX77687.1 50S ribosomal protein L22 [Methanobacterium sp.]